MDYCHLSGPAGSWGSRGCIGVGDTAGVAQLTKAQATRVVAQIELSPLPE